MASVWITKRRTLSGEPRYRVMYRVPGKREGRYGGSFHTRREAELRREWVRGELAEMRIPNLRAFKPIPAQPVRFEHVEGVIPFQDRGEGRTLLSVVNDLRKEQK